MYQPLAAYRLRGQQAMKDVPSHVKNPLTVIAIFAGLAEVSGTGVLPLLSADTQATYVWFLMIFPCLIVTLFFGTLLFKYHVLYAPSDYRDDDTFARLFERGSARQIFEKLSVEASAFEELDDEAGDAEPILTPAAPIGTDAIAAERSTAEPEAAAQGGNLSSVARAVYADHLAKASLAEELALAKLCRELGVDFTRNVTAGGTKLLVDGLALDRGQTIVAEVKYSHDGSNAEKAVANAIQHVDRFRKHLPTLRPDGLSLIVALVIGNVQNSMRIHRVTAKALEAASNAPFPTTIRVFSLSSLQDEFIPAVNTPTGT